MILLMAGPPGLEKWPLRVLLLREAGRLYEMTGDYPIVEISYVKAAGADTSGTDVLADLGMFFERQGRFPVRTVAFSRKSGGGEKPGNGR